MKVFKLAWRNLWRNKRRSLITMTSVFFGVILSAVMTSMQQGSYDSMINNVVKFYSGYAQIFLQEYEDNKTINNTFVLSDTLDPFLRKNQAITYTSPRLEYYALASSEEITRGALILGIEPESEDRLTGISKWIEKGSYLKQGDRGALLSIHLAEYLNLRTGDTLVLYGQGYHGVTAAGLYPVKGILEFPVPEMNNQFVYLSIDAAQQLFGAENRVTSLIIMMKDHHDLPDAMDFMDQHMESPLVARSWDELQPELVQMIEADRAGGVVMKLILYMVIGFGILGTIIMMIAERKRELGITISIGMQRHLLARIVFLETVLTGLIGALLGIAGSIPIVLYFRINPIKLSGDAAQTMVDMGIEPYLYFSWAPHVFYTQAVVVLALTLVIAIYPITRVTRLKVNSALRA